MNTHIVVLLDRSSSMSIIKTEMEHGLNNFINNQKLEEGKATFSLYKFDYSDYDYSHDNLYTRSCIRGFEIIHNNIDIKDVPYCHINPRGMTALYDAIGRAVALTEKNVKRNQKVVFLIITDGKENASEKFTRTNISEMIRNKEEKKRWKFIFMGANQDAIMTGEELGIRKQSSLTYGANAIGTQSMFKSIDNAVRTIRKSSRSEYVETVDTGLVFESADYVAQEKAGVSCGPSIKTRKNYSCSYHNKRDNKGRFCV